MPGGIGFATAGIQPAPRDGVIRWSADARGAGIGRVVCNDRFLLPSGDRVKGHGAGGGRPGTVSALSWRRPSRGRGCPARAAGRRSGVRRAVWRRPQRAPGWSGTLHCAGGRAGVRPEPAPRRPGQEPDRGSRDGHAPEVADTVDKENPTRAGRAGFMPCVATETGRSVEADQEAQNGHGAHDQADHRQDQPGFTLRRLGIALRRVFGNPRQTGINS